MRAINFSTKKVGGIRFIKLGLNWPTARTLCFSFCVCDGYRPLGAKRSRVHRPDNAFRMLDVAQGELAMIRIERTINRVPTTEA